MAKSFAFDLIIQPVPQSYIAAVSSKHDIVLVNLFQGQYGKLSLILVFLLVRLTVLKNIPNANRGIMTAAGNMNSIHQENHLSYLLLVASEPVHDRERVPVPYSDQLLLLLGNHNQESPTGLNELY